MYAYLKGEIIEKSENYLVLDVAGVGYELTISSFTYDALGEVGSVASVYTYFQVREDAMCLYGFATKNEKAVFLELITVSGVGPKMASTILSGMTPSQLVMAITTGDIKTLASVKGLGRKTAERIIVELKEHLGDLRGIDIVQTELSTPISTSATDEAVDVLAGMGLGRMEAINLVKSVATIDMTTEEIITLALRHRG